MILNNKIKTCLLCNINNKSYIIEMNFLLNQWKIKMNMIISGFQNNTKEWSHILSNLENQIPNMSTPNIIYKP